MAITDPDPWTGADCSARSGAIAHHGTGTRACAESDHHAIADRTPRFSTCSDPRSRADRGSSTCAFAHTGAGARASSGRPEQTACFLWTNDRREQDSDRLGRNLCGVDLADD